MTTKMAIAQTLDLPAIYKQLLWVIDNNVIFVYYICTHWLYFLFFAENTLQLEVIIIIIYF